MMKTKLFIDFDGTLFNTSLLKESFICLLNEYGISRQDFLSAYRDECKNNLFTIRGVVRRIHNLTDDTIEAIVKREVLLHDNNPKLLYDDSIEFLEKVDREEYELNLITLGDPEFHKYKIGKSGIEHYFDNIYYATCEKWLYFDSVVEKEEKFILIDDRSETIFFVQHKFPRSIGYCIVRNDTDVDDLALEKKFEDVKVIKRLKEIKL